MIIKIGKAVDNNFIVNDPHVSRHHAQLIHEEEGWILEDLNSTNGTFVNGVQIVKKSVTLTDTIKLGDNYVLPFALPGIIGIIIGFLGERNPLLLGVSLFIAICAPTIGIYLGAKQSAKIPLLLQDLVNQFKIDYVCPKCGTFLGEVPWESLRNRKQCPVSSCKAKWVSE